MNLESMSVKDLRHFRERIDAKIVEKMASAKLDLRATFAKMAAECGLSLDDIATATAGKNPKAKRPMMWRDKSTGVEWTGRGRKPAKFDIKRAEKIGS